jgi:hypothetical protein
MSYITLLDSEIVFTLDFRWRIGVQQRSVAPD